MEYLLAGFAVFFVYSQLNRYLGMPTWAWQVVLVSLSFGAWWVLGHEQWLYILAIAGITTIIKGTEALLLVTTDRATVDLLRRR